MKPVSPGSTIFPDLKITCDSSSCYQLCNMNIFVAFKIQTLQRNDGEDTRVCSGTGHSPQFAWSKKS